MGILEARSAEKYQNLKKNKTVKINICYNFSELHL